MKFLAKLIKFVLSVLLAAVIIVVSSFTAVFFLSKNNPQGIFIFDYAVVAQKGEDEKLDVWVIKKTDSSSVEHGDGIVYFDESYKAANAMLGFDGRVMYFDSDSLESDVWVEDDAVVGKIVALWQQK